MEQAHALGDDARLFLNVAIERGTSFLSLADIVGGRGNYQFHARIGQRAHKSEIILTFQDGGLICPEPFERLKG
jgi:hypothetical protein